MNPNEQASIRVPRPRWASALIRLVGILVVAWAVGAGSRWIYAREVKRSEPAGFLTGILHGAAMPCALPALALGSDPVIYTPRNTGRTYKLGYTIGVNACGAVFFGLLYRRLARARSVPGLDPGRKPT